mmetsp:Transcript_38906/g.76518  ORF Transcript_38906/g.76518 Transcript_38906/m.76518 type:complete len:271 (+) Transcript_38906:1314-2126(+)
MAPSCFDEGIQGPVHIFVAHLSSVDLSEHQRGAPHHRLVFDHLYFLSAAQRELSCSDVFWEDARYHDGVAVASHSLPQDFSQNRARIVWVVAFAEVHDDRAHGSQRVVDLRILCQNGRVFDCVVQNATQERRLGVRLRLFAVEEFDKAVGPGSFGHKALLVKSFSDFGGLRNNLQRVKGLLDLPALERDERHHLAVLQQVRHSLFVHIEHTDGAGPLLTQPLKAAEEVVDQPGEHASFRWRPAPEHSVAFPCVVSPVSDKASAETLKERS